MPLRNGYGLVIGTEHDYYRDPPDDYGRYYHGNLVVHAPPGNYHCAIDVDPKNAPDGIQWRIVRIRPADLAALTALPDGWHPLASTPTSGALDYPRSPVLHPPFLINWVRYDSWLSRLLGWLRWNPPWNSGTGIQALTDLESILTQGVRFYVFGEPFTSGLGVHNIHQNQGDPPGGGHDEENAIWQDGATIVQTTDGRLLGFLNKFKTQSFRTDDAGHPL
ncbi:MAG: YukJ family protein [Actinobacteria bacterium]|nr:YukJ family protein [Actinomycetota bacterium]